MVLNESKCWRGPNKYSGQLTLRIYSTIWLKRSLSKKNMWLCLFMLWLKKLTCNSDNSLGGHSLSFSRGCVTSTGKLSEDIHGLISTDLQSDSCVFDWGWRIYQIVVRFWVHHLVIANKKSLQSMSYFAFWKTTSNDIIVGNGRVLKAYMFIM